MYDCKAPLSRFYYPDTRRIINAFIIIYLLLLLLLPKHTSMPETGSYTYVEIVMILYN